MSDAPEALADNASLNDEDVAALGTQFIHTWVDLGDAVTTPSDQLRSAVVCELNALGVSPDDGTVTYHPDLQAVMVLGGGGKSAEAVLDRYGDVVPGLDPLDYFTPVDGSTFAPLEEKADEVAANGYYPEECSTGNLLRLGPGQWAALADDLDGAMSGGVTQEVTVAFRDVRDVTC